MAAAPATISPNVPVTVCWPGQVPRATTAYRLARGSGLGGGRDALVYRNVLASYTHLHTAGAPTWAAALAERGSPWLSQRSWIRRPQIAHAAS